MKISHRLTQTDTDLLGSDLAVEVVDAIVDKALKKYKIDRVTASDIVVETMAKHPKFLELLEKQFPLKKIQKTRSYDDIGTKAKRKIYYTLRQYNKNCEVREALIDSLKDLEKPSFCQPGGEYGRVVSQLAWTHVSMRERLEHLDFFYSELFSHIGSPSSVLDVGCGMFPLLFPFDDGGKDVACYAALDKDITCISALEAFSRISGIENLYPVHWNIKDRWRNVVHKTGVRRFDVAFLMKLVPVVSRIERGLLNILLETPAQTWVLSGCRNSMTKNIDIEPRERKILRQFIEKSGKRTVGEFSTPEEFCIIVTQPFHS